MLDGKIYRAKLDLPEHVMEKVFKCSSKFGKHCGTFGVSCKSGEKFVLCLIDTLCRKNVNLMLEEYTRKILPDGIEGWEKFAKAEQERIKEIHFYFCGLHYVIGLADQAEGALNIFDRLLYNDTALFSTWWLFRKR